MVFYSEQDADYHGISSRTKLLASEVAAMANALEESPNTAEQDAR